MLPVTDKNITLIDLNKNYKKIEEKKYQKLLKEQLYWLNRNDEKLYKRSKKLYSNYINKKLNKKILDRCCNFVLLEEKCNDFNILT